MKLNRAFFFVTALVLVSSSAAARPQDESTTPKPAEPKAPTAEPKAPATEPAPVETKPQSPDATTKTEGTVMTAPTTQQNQLGEKVEAPAPTESAAALELRPYLTIAGGLKGDNVIDREKEDRDDRFVTFAVARFGVLGKWGKIVTVQSELMASGGYGLHGTSAYEGQAALQVRQQMIRL